MRPSLGLSSYSPQNIAVSVLISESEAPLGTNRICSRRVRAEIRGARRVSKNPPAAIISLPPRKTTPSFVNTSGEQIGRSPALCVRAVSPLAPQPPRRRHSARRCVCPPVRPSAGVRCSSPRRGMMAPYRWVFWPFPINNRRRIYEAIRRSGIKPIIQRGRLIGGLMACKNNSRAG